MKCLFCGPLLLAVACGSGSKGGSSRGSDDGAPTDDTVGSGAPVTDTSTAVGDTALDDTGSSGGDDGGDTGEGPYPYTVVPLDEGDYTTLTTEIGGWTTSVGSTLALTNDLWGDARPEVVSGGFFQDEYGVDSWTFVFDSDYFSTGPKAGTVTEEARLLIFNQNGGAYSLPSVIGDIDGDGLDELALGAGGDDASSILIRGDHLASLSGWIRRADLEADMTFSGCPFAGYDFADVWYSGYLSDPSRLNPDLVFDCWGNTVLIHASDLSDGEIKVGEEGQVRIYNSDTWGGDPVVEGDHLYKPAVLDDLDGDGLDELAIPMWSKSEPYNYIFYGDSLDFEAPTSVTDADVVFKAPDEVSWGDFATFYFEPTALSDVDGDGVSDVLWSSGYAQVDEREALGIAWLWSGSRLASPMVGDVGDADVTFTADLGAAWVGDSAADVGDVDVDGLSDLLIHSSGYALDDEHPPAFVHLVRGAQLIGGGTYNLDEAGMAFLPSDSGFAMSGLDRGEYAGGQDLDGDGVGDLLIGNGDWAGDSGGRIWMIPGGTLPL